MIRKTYFSDNIDYTLNFKLKNMTYIVGGKLNNNPFLMIDCKSQTENKNYIFNDKVVQFYSCNEQTYFCQMGNAGIKLNILIYDTILDFRIDKIDVFDIRQIRDMFNHINIFISDNKINTVDYTHSHIFFISKSDICRYTVNFNNERLYHNISKTNITDNTCITSNSPLVRNVPNLIDSSELSDFCKDIIEEEKMNIVDDLKDRYTFIYTENNTLIHKTPFKNEYDIINQFYGLGFDKI